jgi:Urea transporter
MGALASCSFPFLNRWKGIVDRNKFAAFIDAILSGWAQIILSDNSLSGLLIMIGVFIASPQVGGAALWASFIAAGLLFVLKVTKMSIRLGIYVFGPTLTGALLSVFLFPKGFSVMFFAYIGLASIFCVFLAIAIGQILHKWECPALGLPFGLTVFFFMAAAQNFGFVEKGEFAAVASFAAAPAYDLSFWSGQTIFLAFSNGASQLLGLTNLTAAILFLAAIIISSRIDTISGLIGVFVATGAAIYFGAPKIPVLLGIYGFNGLFLMLALTGRAFTLNLRSAVVNIILVILSTIVAAGLSSFFSPLSISFTALPFSIVGITAMIASPALKGLEYNKPLYWGVPETVQDTKEWFRKNPSESAA